MLVPFHLSSKLMDELDLDKNEVHDVKRFAQVFPAIDLNIDLRGQLMATGCFKVFVFCVHALPLHLFFCSVEGADSNAEMTAESILTLKIAIQRRKLTQGLTEEDKLRMKEREEQEAKEAAVSWTPWYL